MQPHRVMTLFEDDGLDLAENTSDEKPLTNDGWRQGTTSMDKPSYEDLEKKIRKLELEIAELKRRKGSLAVDSREDVSPEGYAGRDVMEQENGEDMAGQNETDYRQFFVMESDALFLTASAGGRILDSNPAASVIYGYTWEELVRMRAEDLSAEPEKTRQGARKRLKFIPLRIHRKKDGSVFPVEITVSHFIRNGKPVNLAAIRDVSGRKRADEALRRGREELRLTLDATTDGIWKWNFKTNEMFFSPRFYTMLGYEPDEFPATYNRWKELIHPDDLESTLTLSRIFRRTKSDVYENEYRLKAKGGDWRWIHVTGKVVERDDDGGAVRMIGNHQDITARKNTEVSLRLQGMVLDQIHDWVTVTDLDGKITYVNETQCRALSRSPEELNGLHVSSLGEDLLKGATQKEIMEETILHGEWRGEVYHYSPDGTQIVLDCRTTQIKDEKGNAVAFAGIATDMTEKKKAEKGLRESEQKYRKLFEMVSDAILLSEVETARILDANLACVSQYGYSREELLRMTIPELSAEPQQTQKSFDSRQEFIPFRKHRRKDGTIFHVEISVRYLWWDDREVRIGVLRDITERMKIEEAQRMLERQLQESQRMEAIATLAGGIAHDFNNILGIIMGCTELALLELSRERTTRDHMIEVYKAGERARDLVKQILTYSRQEEQERKVLDLGLLTKETLKMLRSSLPATIEIRQTIGKGNLVLANPTHMHQVLMNICINAAQAMNKGGRLQVDLERVELDAGRAAEYGNLIPGSYCRLVVSDTGHGMDSRTMQRIFDPYFTTKIPGEGTGLGLAVVNGIVKANNGGILVTSEVGSGSTFDLVFPCMEHRPIPEPSDRPYPPRGRGERVLLVDDEEVLANTVKKMLEGLGYCVTMVTRGPDALQLFEANPENFEVVFTDQTMPHLTGLDLAAAVRKIRPDMPVILCTGYSDFAKKEMAREACVNAVIMKPILVDDVARAIRGAIMKN